MTTAPRCPRCRSSLVEINLTLQDTDLVMRSCSSCDGRWWHVDGEVVDLTAVVPNATARRSA
jgi:hypothetical protein